MEEDFKKRRIVVPGEILGDTSQFKSGWGTYTDRNNNIIAQIIGLTDLRNRVIYIVPFSGPYIPKVGDLVIGVVINTSIVSWKIDINSPYGASLHASNVLNRSFNPLKDDIRKYFDIGDTVFAEIIAFNRTRDPVLSILGKGLGKLVGGKIIEVVPSKIPRLIGRKGSMINLIKDTLRNSDIVIGKNGKIWIKSRNPKEVALFLKIVRKIEKEAHTSGLTDRIKELIKNEKSTLRGG
ncbi:MAG: exosome complex RNA-binding protein Rrp4 [Candidatus Helarchaeota archaeon]